MIVSWNAKHVQLCSRAVAKKRGWFIACAGYRLTVRNMAKLATEVMTDMKTISNFNDFLTWLVSGSLALLITLLVIFLWSLL